MLNKKLRLIDQYKSQYKKKSGLKKGFYLVSFFGKLNTYYRFLYQFN